MSHLIERMADMAGRTSALKQERMHLRLNKAVKKKIERAAAYAGKTASEFVLDSAVEAAERMLSRSEVITLSEADWNAFRDAILNPPPPTPALIEAAKRYRARVR